MLNRLFYKNMDHWNLVTRLKDNTVIYRNPFAATEAWFLPERKHRPSHTNLKKTPKPLQLHEPQDYCAFCPTNYILTTPEKSRIELQNGDWRLVDQPSPQHVFSHTAEFRRISNLYEIISTTFWQKNYNYELSEKNQEHKMNYLADRQGREHIQSLLKQKLHGMPPGSFDMADMDIERLSDAFFGGVHELIIPRRHYVDGATDEAFLASTGELTPDEHVQYLRLTCRAVDSIYSDNPFVKYVAVYTNWRRDAGASFEHLHRQIIGVDRFGQQTLNSLKLVENDPGIFRDYVRHVAFDLNFILCENEHAIAFVDIGHTFSSIAIYSKSSETLPWRQSPEELRGMSDIIHAIHAAFGADEPVNEEWYYQPPNSPVRTPWYVLIRWRNHRHAGIENITTIFPDEYGPIDLKNILLGKLVKLRQDGKIAAMVLDSECDANGCELKY